MAANKSPASGLTEAAFFDRLAYLNAPKKFAVAVSGGRDSMALARLCAVYAAKHGAKVVAFTVDHRLRAEAKEEAVKANAWCVAAGLEHHILKWQGEKPASGLQAAARNARYRLLIEAAQAHGCDALLTAHSEDDQAETMFMRLTRGAGLRGLAAMRDESLVASGAGAPTRLLRPLLAFSRESVTGYLHAIEQDYIDDPSNVDDKFERVRVRALLAALSEQSLLTAPSLAASARKLAQSDDALRMREEALFNQLGGCFYGWGGVSVERWEDAPGVSKAGAAGLARRLIHAVSGGEYAPEGEAALAAVEQAVAQKAATLAGALILSWRGRLWFLREPAALTGRAGVPPMAAQGLDGPFVWDRRFVIAPVATDGGLEISPEIVPLGDAAKAFLGPRAGLFHAPPEGLSAQPGLSQQGVLIGAPALPFMGAAHVSLKSLIRERFQGRIIRFS